MQPDQPKLCHFWLRKLLSSFDLRGGSNEEGLQVAILHLARFVFYYTSHAVPACLCVRLAVGPKSTTMQNAHGTHQKFTSED